MSPKENENVSQTALEIAKSVQAIMEQDLTPEQRERAKSLMKLAQQEKKLKRLKTKLYKQLAMFGSVAALVLVITIAVSTAWYTNVSKSTGLSFEIEQWGFEGEIEVNSLETDICPGSVGVLDIAIKNTSEYIISSTISVDKDEMDEEMKKRLYFYLDVPKQQEKERLTSEEQELLKDNSKEEKVYETAPRTYLNSKNYFEYTIMDNSDLIIEEDVQSDNPIKWEWVLDNLGYYVKGYFNEDPSTEGQSISSAEFVAQEYLFPISYDLNSATFEENGQLEFVDEETDRDTYIRSLLETDCYESDRIEKTANGETVKEIIIPEAVGNYYPVDIDQYGVGVWLYVADYEAIMKSSLYDTAWGILARNENTAQKPITVSNQNIESSVTVSELPQMPVTLNITGQQKGFSKKVAGTEEDLKNLLLDESCDLIQLSNNITLTSPLIIERFGTIYLDLNQNTLIYSPEKEAGQTQEELNALPMLGLNSGTSLVITNGDLITSEDSAVTQMIKVSGAKLSLKKVNVIAPDKAIYINDHEELVYMDSYVSLEQSSMKSLNNTITIEGNGAKTSDATRLRIIESSVESLNEIAIVGTLNEKPEDEAILWGTKIQIIDSQIKGLKAGIYHPQQQSELYIEATTIKAGTPLVMEGGEAYLKNASLTAEKPFIAPSNFVDGGCNFPGSAIYIETDVLWDIKVTLNGNNSLLTANIGTEEAPYFGPETYVFDRNEKNWEIVEISPAP